MAPKDYNSETRSKPMTDSALAIFWFRRDLRLHDNHGLYRVLQDHNRVLPLFIFDKRILERLEDPEDPRVSFIHKTLTQCHGELERMGSGLLTFHSTPEQVFEQLAKTYNLAAVYTNEDYEPYPRKRDQRVEELLTGRGIAFHRFKDQCIFAKNEVLTGSGQPYSVFTPYKRRWLERLTQEHLASYRSEALQNHFAKITTSGVIPLAEMGFKPSPLPIPEAAIERHDLSLYDQLRDDPARDATSHLGIHLRFGTRSIREIAGEARELNQTWLSQLIWRDFYMQILWHHPRVVNRAFREKYDHIQWRDAPADFERWCAGLTGYPIVDAGMRQLAQTGYMHNRVRMITASFLCKHLLIDWRKGERYLAAKLRDYDLAANNGNWQWAAGTGCDAAPYFRVFNPWRQTERFDPEETYIRRWLPEYGSAAYPQPMVDHKAARERAIRVYKEVLGE